MNLILFMTAFMYELENKLNKNLKYFDDVKFQFDEANTDQQIKIRIKNFILENFTKIENVTEILENGQSTDITTYSFRIVNVKTPSDLNEDDRNFIKSTRNAVYTNPDLLFFVDTGESIIRIPVEVKSTKNDKIPGSSIQQVVPDDWVIFIKHDEKNILEFTTGKYVESISGTMQFPDRSPRPQVSFNNLKNWNNNFRKFNNGQLEFLEDENLPTKFQILNDWQMSLAIRWMNVLKSKKKAKEPWFNNTIRKFSALLLNYYDSISVEQQSSFKNNIVENITEDEDE